MSPQEIRRYRESGRIRMPWMRDHDMFHWGWLINKLERLIFIEAEREIIEEIEKLLARCKPPHLRFHFQAGKIIITGDNMDAAIVVGTTLSGFISGADALGNPTSPSIANLQFSEQDASIAIIDSDGTTATGFTVTAVAEGSTQLGASATVTDPDGAVTDVIGTATITVTAGTTPGSSTAALVFNFAPVIPITPALRQAPRYSGAVKPPVASSASPVSKMSPAQIAAQNARAAK